MRKNAKGEFVFTNTEAAVLHALVYYYLAGDDVEGLKPKAHDIASRAQLLLSEADSEGGVWK